MVANYCKVFITIILFNTVISVYITTSSSDTIHLYYGLEESERGVPACTSPAHACSVLLQRYWRPAALVRLCRCPRRRACPPSPPPANTTLALNNRAHFKFCEPISNLPPCKNTFVGLSVEMRQPNYSPDEFESLHHSNTLASPPRVTAYCTCDSPHYWHYHSSNTSAGVYPTMRLYRCAPLGECGAHEYCGNVREDVESLYQRCACPAGHACVHSGGLQLYSVEELMYRGRARKAYCEPIEPANGGDSDEYYDQV